jgi:glycerophosphoryl diester phosphodiesterase
METDTRSSADGVALAFHDPVLDRVADRRGEVHKMTWAQLREAKLADGGAIPRLEELLGAWPEVRWNIDLKDGDAIEPALEAVRRASATSRVLLTAFSGRRTANARRGMGPGLATGAGRWTVAALRAAAFVPARRPSPHAPQPGTSQAQDRPVVLRGRSPSAELARGRAGGFLARLAPGAAAAQVPVRQYGLRVVNQAFLRTAHSAGLAVHVWTIDDASVMEELLDLGVDGIMTNRPSTLKAVLVARGQWS